MDEKLLAEARQAQERLIDAERDADVARAEFHRAVRRLHLHGASLRELASGLGLSHQRVHQIVESAGGSRRWLRGDRDRGRPRPGAAACTFCGKDQKQVKKLIAGPSVYICDGCVDLAKVVLSAGQPVTTEIAELTAGPAGRAPDCSAASAASAATRSPAWWWARLRPGARPPPPSAPSASASAPRSSPRNSPKPPR